MDSSIDLRKDIFPSFLHTEKLLYHLRPLLGNGSKHSLFLQSHATPFRNDTDREMPHRTESNFFYLTGCDVPGASLWVEINDDGKGFRHTLFIPPVDPDTIMWSVQPPTIESASQKYQTHQVLYSDSLSTLLLSSFSSSTPTTIHTLPQTKLFPDLPSHIVSLPATASATIVTLTDSLLLSSLHKSRLTKTPHEIALLRKANEITCKAHHLLMTEMHLSLSPMGSDRKFIPLKEHRVQSEGDAEALFVYETRRQGAKHLSYMPIVASGPRAATLHYICNHEPFHVFSSRENEPHAFSSQAQSHSQGANGGACGHSHEDTDVGGLNLAELSWKPQVLLVDAGCEYDCYAADITRTIPIGNGGKFLPETAAIYDIVLEMQAHAEKISIPPVHWDHVQQAMHSLLAQRFLSLGIFSSSFTLDELLQSGVTTAFFPHGLGHSIGLDVHDVPSASKPEKGNATIPDSSNITPELYQYLRLRLPLEAGMVLTIEPGIYFSPHLLKKWRGSKFINHDILTKYEPVGGIRIEDCYVIMDGGVDRLSTGALRERNDVEKQ